MAHYLYFAKRADANGAGHQLRSLGLTVEVRKGGDGTNWLVLASTKRLQTSEGAEDLNEKLESLAEKFGGEYDGWAMRVEK